MPTLKEIRKRFTVSPNRLVLEIHQDEVLVADHRGELSPSQQVDRKFTQVLDSDLLAHLQDLRRSRLACKPR